MAHVKTKCNCGEGTALGVGQVALDPDLSDPASSDFIGILHGIGIRTARGSSTSPDGLGQAGTAFHASRFLRFALSVDMIQN